ncbi:MULTISPECIES: phosphoribosylanthranilate isomerase [unclassified Wenzhouxiangella]|uniref:phosphoribosylanthranilate isomerase n=1 Tax=unclassified Wenzhouxiangella TaxID=2613841 RepID=UPI000E32A8CD|nr:MULTISPECIES: phosphoribosylanthranilate isomerase [unclassified Wenzhouxiangella]RFF27627.1 phosphoribosylanthranilate isomerase [Wenzhouxiangella sp. 15181]RFP70169.1 phosphoribosylanthranilate isomerase [Wenzhouxiangella sp. 15190]
MIRIKICGITRIEDALSAATAGADAIGLVFAEKSPRLVDIEQAVTVCRALPPFVSRVGLFMDATAETVAETLEQVPLDWLQFHGREDQDFCRQFGRPWMKALAMGGERPEDPTDYERADALLLDAHAPGKAGGGGEVFDWARVPRLDRPWVLAGGLNPVNVAEACRLLQPDAVDVSSGVEVRPGVKSDKLIHDFIKAVKDG